MADSTVDQVARTNVAVALLVVGAFPASHLVVMIGRDVGGSAVRRFGGSRFAGRELAAALGGAER
uniref:Uncharacterized protein n=1 Tax=Mycobacterium riyadhense TaxID=486698 RepID=A0A653ELG4_9MYCO|nr:hypothetical protein BIN_B_02500 [Mycobacterium riyadhense]